MEKWNAKKMLDLYIHDYLVRKNLYNAADTLAQEANIQPQSVVINPPEGFLSEWWSIFWDVYSCRVGINPWASTSTAPQTCASVDVNYMVQNICPQPNLLPSEMGSLLSVVPPSPRILNPQFARTDNNYGCRRRRVNNRRQRQRQGIDLGPPAPKLILDSGADVGSCASSNSSCPGASS